MIKQKHFSVYNVFTGHSEQQTEAWLHQLFPSLSVRQQDGY